MKRRHRPFAAALALIALLFAQAMASVHACDVMTAASAAAMATAPGAPGDNCGEAPSPRDSICDNHCQQGKQLPQERAQSLFFAPFAAVAAAAFMVSTASFPSPAPPVAPDLVRDTQPPLSIRNCCFRI